MTSWAIFKRIGGLCALATLSVSAPHIWAQGAAPQVFSVSPLEAAVGSTSVTLKFSGSNLPDRVPPVNQVTKGAR
jgi:hypothetical protein